MPNSHDPSEVDLDGFPVAADPQHLQARETLEVLLTRFTEEMRRGEKPSVDAYALAHPSCADEIRELFPLVTTLEKWKVANEVDSLRRNVPAEFPVRRLGAYRLVRELGRGGMGIVFEAVQDNSKRRFAVKLLPWRFAGNMPQWKARFHREAATIAKLRHPNIVRVYSFGIYDGYCYYVMQLVSGVSLDVILRRWRESPGPIDLHELGREAESTAPPVAKRKPRAAHPPPILLSRDAWQEFAGIGLQVARALASAHAQGIVHNDVKPANLLLTVNGQVIVTDFGVGLPLEEDLVGGEQHATGTLRYMAPERLLGGGGGAPSDIYALGVTLYELVTQTPAFDARDRGPLVERILQGRPPRPRQLVPALPRALETIILNAMAADPAERYPSADAFAVDLLRFRNGQPIQSRRFGRWKRAVRWCRRLTVSLRNSKKF
jgi:serine/threonine protein kinase